MQYTWKSQKKFENINTWQMMARHCQGHNPWVQGQTEGQ